MKVILRPYCSFATMGFSEMKLCWQVMSVYRHFSGGVEGVAVYSREHLPLDGKGKRDDEDHEQTHLCHKQEEDLVVEVVLAVFLATLAG